jgi:hypothetical protein
MEYLRFHYGEVYDFTADGDKYAARAKFRDHEVLEAGSPAELLTLVRRHYPGTRADLSST